MGDLRIAFTFAPNGPASFIGRQSGSDISDYQTKSGDRLLMARSGLVSADEMFKVAEDENRAMTWILRLVGVVVMLFGFLLLLLPLSVVADVVPLIGNIVGFGAFLAAVVLAPLLIAFAWLWHQSVISIAVLIVGLAVAFGFLTLASRRTAARAQTAR